MTALRAASALPMNELNELIENINDFNYRFPQEKVFLHFDNTAYFLKETIWFSAYVVRADDAQPTHLSRVLYVELLSPEGAVIETKKSFPTWHRAGIQPQPPVQVAGLLCQFCKRLSLGEF